MLLRLVVKRGEFRPKSSFHHHHQEERKKKRTRTDIEDDIAIVSVAMLFLVVANVVPHPHFILSRREEEGAQVAMLLQVPEKFEEEHLSSSFSSSPSTFSSFRGAAAGSG